jgi:hypothetical protein
MKIWSKMLIGLGVLALFGCDSGGDHHHYVEVAHGPELYGFHMIDSFHVNSETDHVTPLELDPEVDGGLFEVFWYAESDEDYEVRIGVNDRPTMAGATIVANDICGWDLACDEEGSFICEYKLTGEIGCGLDLYEVDHNLESINHLLETYPQELYVNIEVCGLTVDSCEVSSLPVDVY